MNVFCAIFESFEKSQELLMTDYQQISFWQKFRCVDPEIIAHFFCFCKNNT